MAGSNISLLHEHLAHLFPCNVCSLLLEKLFWTAVILFCFSVVVAIVYNTLLLWESDPTATTIKTFDKPITEIQVTDCE